MSDDHVQEELLHRYFDGEIGDRQAARVRQHVETCSHCTAQIEALSKLHGLFAIAAEGMADSLHSEPLFERISKGMHEAPAPGLGERLRLWWDDLLEPLQPRGVWLPVTVAAVGAAAALLIVLRPGVAPNPSPPGQVVADAPSNAPATPADPAPLQAAVAAPVLALASEIVQVDFGANAGTIFEVALNEGESTPVVWIDEEE